MKLHKFVHAAQELLNTVGGEHDVEIRIYDSITGECFLGTDAYILWYENSNRVIVEGAIMS